MEVVAATPGGGGVSPFHDHDVREWSRLDSITGVLERARLETDHWTANTNNSSHKYGKVVDSRARTNADGALQQNARRQLEVFQSQIPGGHLQVIKTHTVSSSRWSNKSGGAPADLSKDFENLQLSLNPLDLSSQKSKANVGRSVGRRPPSRPRARDESSTAHHRNPLRSAQETAATNLYRVSRLCHQIHDSTVKQTFGKYAPILSPKSSSSVDERENDEGSIEIVEIESVHSSNTNESSEVIIANGEHGRLNRTKSNSSEDLHNNNNKPICGNNRSIEDLEDLEQLQSWRRTSKIRRSLQYPSTKQNKPADFPVELENTGSVRKIREELEKGRRLSTALRGNNVDLEALDQILQSISSSDCSAQSDKASVDDDLERDEIQFNKKQKRNSFVTVETLQQVRGRLRRTSSPTITDDHIKPKEEETDDGIVTEEMPVSEVSSPKSRVRSYVFGMEALINNTKTPVSGTGSLESRSKLLNGNANVRNEDWYNRRKSYGFEQVHAQHENTSANSLKSRVESSTDSGICRSSEIVVVPPTKTEIFSDSGGTTNKFGNVRKMSSIFDQSTTNRTGYSNSAFVSKDWKEGDTYKTKSDLKSTTITIPIVSSNRQPNFIDFTWDDKPEKDIKRHSIAVDESKYVVSTNSEPRFRRTSLAINESRFPSNGDNFIDDGTTFAQNRKLKRVEFCKTEVHFAAESGKVNIVETDEKPPPTNNFRRRRRNSGPTIDFTAERNGLPILHFGDSSYEKSLLGVSDTNDEFNDNTIITPTDEDTYQSQTCAVGGTVTVNSSFNNHHRIDSTEEQKYAKELDSYVDNDNIKGILKNKPIKPTPYHLGENEVRNFFNNNASSCNNSDRESSDSSGKWGVRLKPVPKSDTPFWKSTVTLHNTVYNNNRQEDHDSISESNNQPEFQRLLKNLRPTTSAVKPDLINTTQQPPVDGYHNSGVKFIAPPDNNANRKPWAVADRVKLNEENQQWNENNKYSTKISFRDGSTTVIENDHGFGVNGKVTDSRWAQKESANKDSRQILNRGLVVRIGRDDYTSTTKHTVCSKTTTQEDRNNTTTTTKITIDLSPSPTDPKCNSNEPPLPSIVPRAKNQKRSHSFKSTSLILDTIIKNGRTNHDAPVNGSKIPQQLEALKKLYEDVQSDSDADKEVQVLMGEIDDDNDVGVLDEDDVSSVVSGSWSKMRAFKQINEHVSKASHIREIPSVRLSAKIEKGDSRDVSPKRVGMFDSPAVASNKIHKPRPKESPVAQRRVNLLSRRSADLKTAVTSEKLSSPSLVGRSSSKLDLTEDSIYEKAPRADPNVNNDQKYMKNEIVLRQPKKSEMTYFGVPSSPKNVRRALSAQSQTVIERRSRKVEKLESKLSDDKPDLLQHHMKSDKTSNKSRRAVAKKQSPERINPSPDKNESPIYENVHTKKVANSRNVREFDNSILEELTKAADQILQAVNGFTDEDTQNRLTADEEKEPLATISETKSWSQEKKKTKTSTTTTNLTRSKLKHTSSTSSIDSITAKDLAIKRATPTRRSVQSKTVTSNERLKKTSSKTTSTSDSTTTKATTKASRRLQRASSREALLQSHGSSSEDLGAHLEAPLRKPRQIKKTKAMQLTITNGIEMNHKRVSPNNNNPNPPHRRRRDDSKSRTEETIRSEALPEIRHKTAVSTIRSTAERSTAGRDRSKTRTSITSQEQESPKRKVVSHHHKRDISTRGVTSSVSKSDPKIIRSATSRDTVNHRISTANIKKCQRSDGTPRH